MKFDLSIINWTNYIYLQRSFKSDKERCNKIINHE